MLAHLARVQVLVVGGRQIQTTGGDRHVDLGMGEPILSSRIDLVQRLGQDRGLLLQAQFDGSGHSCEVDSPVSITFALEMLRKRSDCSP